MRKPWLLIIGMLLVVGIALWWLARTPTQAQTVTVYISEDQVFSEPILQDFERETGIRVKAVYDTEEAKSTGAMNRLIAEKNNPQADVYWANEPLRAELLKQRGISAPYISPNAAGIPDVFKDPEGYWTGFSARARILVVNKNAREKPQSIRAYADPRWKGKGIIANPLFGTTTVEIAALFAVWGDEPAKSFLQQMKKNGVRISTSNGESADLVASGEAEFGLVDSDDGFSRIKQGKPVEMVFPDQGGRDIGTLIVPNAAVLIKEGPNPAYGRKLIDYLLSKETERKLAFADCAQIPLHSGVERPAEVTAIDTIKVMQISYAEVARKIQTIQPYLAGVGY